MESARSRSPPCGHSVSTEPSAIISAEQPADPAAQLVTPADRLEVRWQVAQSWGRWWDLPQSADIDLSYKQSKAVVTYEYDWGNGEISHYQLDFAKRQQLNIDTGVIRRVRRAFVEPIVHSMR